MKANKKNLKIVKEAVKASAPVVDWSANANRKATYSQVKKVAMTFATMASCPKDLGYNSFRGYLLNKLNAKRASQALKQKHITEYLSLKRVPKDVIEAIREVKKARLAEQLL